MLKACVVYIDKRKWRKLVLNSEERNVKRKEKRHFRWSDEMHSSLNECFRSYIVSCELTNTDFIFDADISEVHINTIKLSQTPSIKKVCLYLRGYISIYLHNLVISVAGGSCPFQNICFMLAG